VVVETPGDTYIGYGIFEKLQNKGRPAQWIYCLFTHNSLYWKRADKTSTSYFQYYSVLYCILLILEPNSILQYSTREGTNQDNPYLGPAGTDTLLCTSVSNCPFLDTLPPLSKPLPYPSFYFFYPRKSDRRLFFTLHIPVCRLLHLRSSAVTTLIHFAMIDKRRRQCIM
jgi:hypothetical protein